jgi:peptide/nickel transport system ATP-binding protein
MSLLEVRDLAVEFDTDEGTLRAVDGVSFDVDRGETVCLVGESGSGKTVACESLTKLIPMPPGEIVSGTVRFEGRDLAPLPESAFRSIRGDRIAHVFQNPQGALDPVYAVGRQVAETLRIHRDVPASEARERAVDLLDRVGIPDAAARAADHPHEFSGGMKQRVAIAAALAADPDLLVADEPTTALDVTIQAQILDLLGELQDERGMSVLFVTHDLGVAAEIADRVVVLYGGTVMERGPAADVLSAPAHPYTRALLRAIPGDDGGDPIEGSVVDPMDPPAGCRFHPRCPHAVEECRGGDQPALAPVDDRPMGAPSGPGDRDAACVFYHPEMPAPPFDADGTRATVEDPAERPRANGGGDDR